MADVSLEEQVEGRLNVVIDGSSTVSQADLSQWATDGLREIVRLLKQQGSYTELFKFMRKITATSNVITITDNVTMDSSTNIVMRFNDAKQDAYLCRETPITNSAYLNDPLHVEYATKQNPAYYLVTRNTMRVIPAPTSDDYVDVYAIDTFDTLDHANKANDGDSAAAYVYDQYWTPLLYYVCAEASMAYAHNDLVTMGALSFANLSEVPRFEIDSALYAAPDLTIDATPEMDLPFDIVLPSFTLPVIADWPDSPEYNAPNKFPDYISVDTFVADDDAEMSAQALAKVNMEITEYAQELQDAVNEFGKNAKIYETEAARQLKLLENNFTSKLEAYRTEVANKIKQYESEVATNGKNQDAALTIVVKKYEIEAQKKLKDAEMNYTNMITNVQNELQKYAIHVQAYTQEVQYEIGQMAGNTQLRATTYQSWMTSYKAYMEKFRNFMLDKMPQPQPQSAQGGQNAR